MNQKKIDSMVSLTMVQQEKHYQFQIRIMLVFCIQQLRKRL